MRTTTRRAADWLHGCIRLKSWTVWWLSRWQTFPAAVCRRIGAYSSFSTGHKRAAFARCGTHRRKHQARRSENKRLLPKNLKIKSKSVELAKGSDPGLSRSPIVANGRASRAGSPRQRGRVGHLGRLIRSPDGKPHLMLASWTGVDANSSVSCRKFVDARDFHIFTAPTYGQFGPARRQ